MPLSPPLYPSLTIVAVLANAASGQHQLMEGQVITLCDRLDPQHIPQECICSEPEHLHAMILCVKPFNGTIFNDTIGMKLDLDVCNSLGSSITLDVTERNHGIEFPIETIHAGDENNIPIPGLSMIVPYVGSFGMDVTVVIAGTPDELDLKVGLNACLKVRSRDICVSDMPGLSSEFPWYILNGKYSFGDVCDGGDSVVNVD